MYIRLKMLGDLSYPDNVSLRSVLLFVLGLLPQALNMTKCSFVAFLSVFVINLSLSYCNDDHNPKNKLRERFIPVS